MKHTVLIANYREEGDVDVYICANKDVADKFALQLIADYVDTPGWYHYNQEHVQAFRELIESGRYGEARYFWNFNMSHFQLDVVDCGEVTEAKDKVNFRWP